jgi:hypothetical protein
MIELICGDCSCHVGWISDSGPIGVVECDECYENNESILEDEGFYE